MENKSTETPIKYFIYCRKSSEDEGKQILSLPAQKKELREFAKKFNLHIVGMFSESRTAFKPGRLQFNEMIQLIEDGKASGIITWQANRIARNSLDGGRFIYMMDEGKIKELKTPGRTFTNSSDDKFILNIEFGMAKKDSDDKSDNVKRGNYYKFHTKNEWIGPAKPGYLNYTDETTKENKIKIDKKRFRLLQKGMKLILSGIHTPMEVLHLLNEEWGYRTRKTRKQGGNPLAKSAWYRILADPYCYGLMVRSEGEKMGTHRKMLDKEEFEKLQVILGRKGRPHIIKHEFSYKEVLKCGECGGSITAEEKWHIRCSKCGYKFQKNKRDDFCPKCKTLIEKMKSPWMNKYVLYSCVNSKKGLCSQGSINIKNIEKRIDGELKKIEIPESLKDWAIKYLNELNEVETDDREQIRTNLESAKDDCIKRRDNLLRLKISAQNTDGSVLSDEEYNLQRKDITSEIESIDRELNSVEKRINRWHELSAKTFNFACYARYWFQKGDLKTKTQILGALGSNLIVKDRKMLIDGHKAFFLIEKGKKELEKEARKFEPLKYLDIVGNLDAYEPLRSTWLGGRDSNPD